ncbi:FIP1[V]-like protein [Canna indica]|uniref:FIP1[V]-like protein n=1 Tax=Canna indica TaxID=4628 RepID=A0AAQ3L2C8_9LILI|nr:FIP1[V]-like protein [Canna indica]
MLPRRCPSPPPNPRTGTRFLDMDDDDEFGELYADVLQPIAAPPSPALLAGPNLPADDFGGGDEDEILSGGSGSAPAVGLPSTHHESVDPSSVCSTDDNHEDDWMLGRAPPHVEPPENWVDEEDVASSLQKEVGAPDAPQEIEPAVLEGDDEETRVSGIPDEDGEIGEVDTLGASKESGYPVFGGGIVENSVDMDEAPVIPGLSAGPVPSGAFLSVNSEEKKPSQSEDWDSDSEDDIQIVLNDSNHPPLGAEKNDRIEIRDDDDDDDDEEEEDLVIVADQNRHHLLPAMEGQDWGEETMQPTGDGERNEMVDAAKVTGSVGTAPGARIAYNSHGFQAQHHSMYKYIRPGAMPLPGVTGPGTVAPPGTARPPVYGGGRGDWRPSGGRGISSAPKGYQTGFGFPAWANSSARTFGGGLDFSLPAHKTIFDVDIESFEEKLWRHPGVDISDFFNFGLDEDKWKDYCKQLDQLRLESTMQSKIHVYESGRSEQGYDPDLPPELAAAAGHRDTTADNEHGKADAGEADFTNQGKGPAVMRAPLPIGRAIQVECGYRERLPSTETRPPRYRDSDSIIEIPLQDSFDDPKAYNYSIEHPEEIAKGSYDKAFDETEKDDENTISGYKNNHSHTSSSRNKEMNRRMPFKNDKDELLHPPSESSAEYHEDPGMVNPESPTGAFGTHHGGREGPSYKRRTNACEQSIDSIPSGSAHSSKLGDQQEILADSTEVNHSSQITPAVAEDTAAELHIEERYGEHDEKLTLVKSTEIEGEEMMSDFHVSNETGGVDNLINPDGKQKLGSRVEQHAMDDSGYEDELQTWSSGTSREKSGSSKDYPKQIENGAELIQEHSSRTGYLKKPHKEDEGYLHQKDESGLNARQETGKNEIASKRKEVPSDLFQHPLRGRSYERKKESESSISSWQRREDNLHRRAKNDTRQENNDETASRHKNRNQKDDYSRKHVEDKEWRGRNRDEVLGKRERDDFMMTRYENIDVPLIKKKRDEEYLRAKADKVDTQHGHRDREDFGRKKRDRDDNLEHKRREVDTQVRDKTEDRLSSKLKDDNWRYRDRDDRQRLKPHESAMMRREREEQRGSRSGRISEDKPLAGNGRNRNDLNNYDKDYPEKERKRHNEHSRRDRAREDNLLQSKGQGDASVREKHSITDERRSRHERLNSYSDCSPSAAGQQHMYRERQRENTRKAKDAEAHDQNSQRLGKRKNEDHHTAHRNEKVYNRGLNEQERSNISSKTLSKKDPHRTHEQHETVSMRQSEADPASGDENNSSRKGGRSKLERWTSHQERDYNVNDNTKTTMTSKPKNNEGNNVDVEQADELAKAGLNSNTGELDGKGADEGHADKMEDEHDRHLDTMAKLKRRSERFKLPMPVEKEIASNKMLESEVQLSNNEVALDLEVKPERPARKRRWTGS